MPLPQARELGALALFGETYGEDVRVVEIGGPWARELCGGTHVQHSSQVGALTVTGESSVGSGVRRVEAFVGMDALRYLARERAIVAELTGLVGARPDELAERVGAMVTRLKDAERELERARKRAGARGRRQPHRAGPRRRRRDASSATTPARGRRRRRAHHGARPAQPARRRAPRRRRRSPAAPRAGRSSSWRPTSRRGSAASGPVSWCGSRPRRSAAVAAARTTSPRVAARTRRKVGEALSRRRVARRGARRLMPDLRGAGSARRRRRHGARRGRRQRPRGHPRDAGGDAGPRRRTASRLRVTGRRGDRRAGRGARGASRWSSGCPARFRGDEGPAAARARTVCCRGWRRASRPSGCVSSTSA